MAYGSRRRPVAALASSLFILVAAGCSGYGSGGGSTASPAPVPPRNGAAAPSQQDLYRAVLLKDLQSLDRGVLTYSQTGNPKTGTTIQFEVTVTDVGRGPQLSRVTESRGMNVYQQDVPTGGIVGVQIIKCANLTCSSESSVRQPVLYQGQTATWWWSITAGTPGPAMITLRADTYDRGSAQSLSEEILTVTPEIVPTPAFNRQQSHKKLASATNSVIGDIEKIGSVAGAVVAVGGVVGGVVAWIRKRRKGQEATKA